MMSKVSVKKISEEEQKALGISQWPVWEKEPGSFPWYYDSTEQCFILEGEVIVSDEEGQSYRIGPGDLVTFHQGLQCEWDITRAIKKHYRFI